MLSSVRFGLFLVEFLCFISRNCLLTTPVCLRRTTVVKPATRCAWLQLCRKVRTKVLHENRNKSYTKPYSTCDRSGMCHISPRYAKIIHTCELKCIMISTNGWGELLSDVLIVSVISQYNVHYCFTDCAVDGECESCCGSFNFEDKDFTVKRGDYAPLMEKVCYYLQQAQVNARDVGCSRCSVCILFAFWNHNRNNIFKLCI